MIYLGPGTLVGSSYIWKSPTPVHELNMHVRYTGNSDTFLHIGKLNTFPANFHLPYVPYTKAVRVQAIVDATEREERLYAVISFFGHEEIKRGCVKRAPLPSAVVKRQTAGVTK